MRKSRIAMVALALTAVVSATVGSALATAPPDHKVGICHRTASGTNPYVFIEVDVASLDAHLNNLPGHPPKTNEDGSPRNDFLASSPEDCVPGYPGGGGEGY